MKILTGKTFPVLAVAAALSATACSGPDPVTETPTVTKTKTTTAEAELPTSELSTSMGATSPAVSSAAAAPAHNHFINDGQIGGDCGTTAYGDTIKAGSKTSCDFAAILFDAALASDWALVAPGPTATAIPATTVTATSPVTGDSYTVSCNIGSDSMALWCGNQDDGGPYIMVNRDYDNPTGMSIRQQIGL